MPQKVNTATPAPSVALSPLARVVRTIIQIVTAQAVSLPTLIAGFGLNAAETAKYDGIISGAVLVASTVQNLLEHFGILPVVGAGSTGASPAA